MYTLLAHKTITVVLVLGCWLDRTYSFLRQPRSALPKAMLTPVPDKEGEHTYAFYSVCNSTHTPPLAPLHFHVVVVVFVLALLLADVHFHNREVGCCVFLNNNRKEEKKKKGESAGGGGGELDYCRSVDSSCNSARVVTGSFWQDCDCRCLHWRAKQQQQHQKSVENCHQISLRSR